MKVLETLEKKREQLNVHDAEVSELKKQVKEDFEKIKIQAEEFEKTAKEKSVGREKLVVQLEKDVLTKYDQVKRKKPNNAVVAALDGACGGCNMKLPPQLFNQLASAKSLEVCPRCQRIVYRPEVVG